MSSPARIPRIYDLRDEQTRDQRDVVVLQAIMNVTDRQLVDGWWDASPAERIQAIYDDRVLALGAVAADPDGFPFVVKLTLHPEAVERRRAAVVDQTP